MTTRYLRLVPFLLFFVVFFTQQVWADLLPGCATISSEKLSLRPECTATLKVTGIEPTSIQWSTTSSNTGVTDSYLSCTNGCTSIKITAADASIGSFTIEVKGKATDACIDPDNTGGSNEVTFSVAVEVADVKPLKVALFPILPKVCGTGTINDTAKVRGGTEPYTYSWNGGGSSFIKNVGAGLQTVTVNDIFTDCEAITVSNDVISITVPIISSVTVNDATTCGGNGNVIIALSAGSGFFDIDLDGDGLFEINNHNAIANKILINNLPIGTVVKNVVVRTAVVQCESSTFAIDDKINAPSNPIISSVNTANASSCSGTGSAVVTISSSSGNYDIDLNGDGTFEFTGLTPNGSSQIVLNSLAIGTVVKNVKIKSVLSTCVSTAYPINTTITAPSAPTNSTSTTSMCADGTSIRSLEGIPTGGTWALDGTSTASIGTVNSGSQTFTVGNVSGTAVISYTVAGCTSQISISVTALPVISSVNTSNASTCGGTGSATITISSPSGNYDVDLNGDGTFESTGLTPNGSNQIVFNSLAISSLVKNVKIKSVTTGCVSNTNTINTTIAAPSTPSIVSSSASMCADGSSTRSLEGTPAGGTWALDVTSTASIGTVNSGSQTFTVGTVNGTAVINYTVAGCTSNISILVNSLPSFTVNTSNASTCTGTGSAAIAITSPSGNYDVDLNGDGTFEYTALTPNISNQIVINSLAIGTVVKNVQIKSVATGCVSTAYPINTSITAPSAPSITSSSANMCADGSSTRSLEGTPAGGTWALDVTSTASIGTVNSGSQIFTVGNVSGTAVINYTVLGCTSQISIPVTALPIISSVNTANASTCAGTGSATITISSPSGSYDVDLNGDGTFESTGLTPNGSNQIILNTLAIGTTIKNVKIKSTTTGCISVANTINTTITAPSAPTNTTSITSMCADGTSTRALVGAPSGGTWSLDAASTASIGTVNSGSQTFTVGSVSGTAIINYTVSGCTTQTSFVVSTFPTISSVTTTNASTCTGTGSATISISSPSGNYDVDLNGDGTFEFTGLTANISNQIIITNLNNGAVIKNVKIKSTTSGCISIANAINTTITVPSAPNITSSTSVLCANGTATRSLSATPTGGTWTLDASSTSGVGTVNSGSQTFTAGTTAGTAKITYSANGCDASFSFNTIALPAITNIVVNNATSCNGSGNATITLSNALGNYDVDLNGDGIYEASNQNLSAVGNQITLSNLAIGTIVKNVQLKSVTTGCESTDYIINTTITAPSTPSNTTVTSTLCADGTSTRALEATPAGGTWSLSPSSTAGIGSISGSTFKAGYIAGTAIVVYTLAGCDASASITLIAAPVISVNVTNPTSCGGTGTAAISISSASGTYDVDLNGDGIYEAAYKNLSPISNVITINGLAEGFVVKNVQVKSNLTGCESAVFAMNATITAPAKPTILTTALNLCADGITQQSLSAGTTGGTWSLASGSTSGVGSVDNINNIFTAGTVAGTAIISYTKNGCTSTVNFTILEIPSIEVVTTNPTTCDGTGSVTISFKSTPSGNFDVDLNGDGIYESANKNLPTSSSKIVINNLPNGTVIKNVKVVSKNTGCESTVFNINQIITTPIAPDNSTSPAALCADGISTQDLISTTPGGTWSLDPNSTSSIGTINTSTNKFTVGTQAGTAIVVYNLNGCQAKKTIPVIGTPSITVSTINPSTCTGTGSAIINFISIPASTYDIDLNGDGIYEYTNQSTSSGKINIPNLALGTIVQDVKVRSTATGCESPIYKINTQITSPEAPDNSTANDAMCANGTSIRNLVTSTPGGTWSLDITSTSSIGTVNSSSNTFTVGTKSGTAFINYTLNGCTSKISIAVVTPPQISVAKTDASQCKGAGSVTITLAEAGIGSYNIDLNGDGIYEVAHQNLVASGNTIEISNLNIGTVIKNVKVKSLITGCESNTFSINTTIAEPNAPDNSTATSTLCGDGQSTRALLSSALGGIWTLSSTSTVGIGSIDNSKKIFTVGSISGTAVITYTKDACETSISFNVIAVPVITVATTNPTTCNGKGSATITFTSTPSGSYDVDLDGDGIYEPLYQNLSPTSNQIIITDLANGTKVSGVTVKSNTTGCISNTSNINQTISAPNAPVILNTTTSMCANGSSTLKLEASVEGGTWDLDASSTPAIGVLLKNVFQVGKLSGTAVINYTAIGCTAQISISVNIPPSITQNDVAESCSGNIVQIGSTAKAHYKYSWLPNDGLSNDAISNPLLTFNSVSTRDTILTYKVTFTDSLSNCSSQDTVKVTIYPKPRPIAAKSEVSLCGIAQQGIAYNVGNTPGSSYTWSIKAGTIVSGQSTASIIVDWNAGYNQELNVVESTIHNCISDTLNIRLNNDTSGVYIKSVSENSTGSIDLNWGYLIDKNTVNQISLKRRSIIPSISAFSTIQTLSATDSSFTDATISKQTIYEYQLEYKNSCQALLQTAVHNNIILNSTTNPNTLSWNKYKGWKEGVKGYYVWKKPSTETSYTLFLTLDSNTTSYTLGDIGNSEQCYKVQAIINSSLAYESYSNASCIDNLLSLTLTIPNAISPNGDKINDTWIIENLHLYPDNEVRVFNQWNSEVYSKKGYTNDWDGGGLPDGSYYYHFYKGKELYKKDFLLIVR